VAEFADLSEVINRTTGGNSGTPVTYQFIKNGRHNAAAAVAPVAGRWTDLGPMEGSPAAAWAGTVPAAEASCDRTTTGALGQANPGGGRELYIVSGGASLGPAAGLLMVYDKLAIVGQTDSAVALSGTVTTAQVLTLDPPARANTTSTTTIGNEIWVGISTQIGTTLTTGTCDYNDQDNNATATSATFQIGGTGLREQHRLIPVPLATGDTGVKQVDNIDLAASTTTAGQLYVMLLRPVCFIPVPVAGQATFIDFLTGIPNGKGIKVLTDASLHLAFLSAGTAVPQVNCWLNMVER
jgi:hypothetical protein